MQREMFLIKYKSFSKCEASLWKLLQCHKVALKFKNFTQVQLYIKFSKINDFEDLWGVEYIIFRVY